MKIDLNYAELHNPLFLAGKNHGLKLDANKIHGLELQYDRIEKELLVSWAGKIGIIPSSNIACMIEGLPEVTPVKHIHPIVAGAQSAQVESPFSHVHAGPGQGKNGKSK